MVTRVSRFGSNDAFLKKSQRLRGLECGAGRILPHDGTVQQGFQRITAQSQMVFSTLPAHHHTGIVSRRRHHAQHLAGRRFYGHDTAQLAFHQTLAERLQFQIESQSQVFAGHSFGIQLSVHVSPFDTPPGITQKYLYPLFAPQLLLVGTFHTLLADEITILIILIFLHIRRRHLTDVPQDQCGIRGLVLTDGTTLHIKTGKTEQLFLKHAELLGRQLAHEKLLGVTRITGIAVPVLDFVHPLDIIFLGYSEARTQIQRVHPLLLVHDHHNVIRRLVVDQQLPVAVGDDSPRRILDFL